MADTITEAVVQGIAPIPFNGVKRVTIDYKAGHSLVLKGATLEMWWAQYIHNYVMAKHVNQGPMAPVMTSEELQLAQDKKESQMPKRKPDEEEE